jgi:Protein of unknown function (DUF2442)
MASRHRNASASSNFSKNTMNSSSRRGTRTSANSGDRRSKDPIDQAIFEQGLRISSVNVLPKKAGLLVLLNSGAALFANISDFPRLKNATADQLNAWSLVANGTAIGWDALDEHLSLKGFLIAAVRSEILQRVSNAGGAVVKPALLRAARKPGVRRAKPAVVRKKK